MSLVAYLRAPAVTQDAFDRRVAEAIRRDCEREQRMALDLAGDPVAERVRSERDDLAAILDLDPEPSRAGVRWDSGWDRRAALAREAERNPGVRELYDRERDPLLVDVDLREAWEPITGEPCRRGIARCPHPEHPDRFPSCAVRTRLWFCNGCPARGSIIDLGALVYGVEPRGNGFFEIRSRLLAACGVQEAA